MSTAHRATRAEISDWSTLPLERGGRCLIEASAGTGKTWTIAVLYLRLLLEQGLSPRQIVVTTFTDAAAQELRERLRTRVLGAQGLAQRVLAGEAAADIAGDDAGNAWLLQRWADTATPAGRDLLRLRLAMAELDLAPVTTLHGLCRKVLADFPFESGSAFGLGDTVTSESILDELCSDAWRVLQQGDAELGADAAAFTKFDSLKARFKAYLAPGVTLWAPSEEDLDKLLPREWAARLRELATRSNLFASRKTALKNALLALADFVDDHAKLPKPSALDNLSALDLDGQLLAERVEEMRADPTLLFARDSVRLIQYRLAASEIAFWQRWVERLGQWRAERLAARGQLTFDELIVRVGDALQRNQGGLAGRLFDAWPVTLVDEFQDTDAQQYAILDRIYRDDDGHPRGRLVMIGDPKQAIYRFRGGDIHAYLAASQAAETTLRLDTNFRSSRKYVAAVNDFYGWVGAGLSANPGGTIEYQAVKPSTRCDAEPYLVEGQPCMRPLALYYESDCPEDAGSRRHAALVACANQIAELLASAKHYIGTRSVAPGDIAVLLPGNTDVRELRLLLQAREVPCVGAGKSNVFSTDWARELQILLYAVLNHSDEGALRAALATRLYGMDFDTLASLRNDPEAWQPYAKTFDDYHRLWQRQGVYVVVQALMQRAGPRLLAAADGERTLTDLRHLGELLQAQDDLDGGAEALLSWLASQRSGEDEDAGEAADEMQLRIESDAKRVRLMTLHASKGLEFPIVFLPLMWKHETYVKDTLPIIHEPLCDQRIAGFGSLAKQQYDTEGQDERFRVLYVALTRAQYACHVYAYPPERLPRKGATNPLRASARSPLDISIARLREILGDRRIDDVSAHIGWSDRGWPRSTVRYRATEDDSQRPRLILREPPRPDFEYKYSFSALTQSARNSALEDSAADDEGNGDDGANPLLLAEFDTFESSVMQAAIVPVAAVAHPELLRLASVKGAEFGNAMHAIFEHRMIGRPLREQHDLIRRCLDDEGVRADELGIDTLVPLLAQRMETALAAEIAPGLRLGELPAEHLRAEMEFNYALGATSMSALRKRCAELGEPDLVPPTSAKTLRGLMNGKIDLILLHNGRFHVVDYKSNDLGDHVEDYAPAVLGAAMDHNNYRFQALLYIVAVDRYLHQRIKSYERHRHLGDAFYLFVRGMGLAEGAGVWRHRFSDELIDAVNRQLATAAAQEAA
jgi:exodeoxyribonuclease V beta subunit